MTTTAPSRAYHDDIMARLKKTPANQREMFLNTTFIHVKDAKTVLKVDDKDDCAKLHHIQTEDWKFVAFKRVDGIQRPWHQITPFYFIAPIVEIRVGISKQNKIPGLFIQVRTHSAAHGQSNVWKNLVDECYLVDPEQRDLARHAYEQEERFFAKDNEWIWAFIEANGLAIHKTKSNPTPFVDPEHRVAVMAEQYSVDRFMAHFRMMDTFKILIAERDEKAKAIAVKEETAKKMSGDKKRKHSEVEG